VGLAVFRGFLWIGDPHLTRVKPERRLDDFAETVFDKLSQAARICHRRKLVAVITGDLFHRAMESSLPLLSKLWDIGKEFPCAPWVLDGNHGKKESYLSDADALTFMAKVGTFPVIREAGFAYTFDFEAGKVNLWGTPHGFPIPKEIDAREGLNVMVTHHDLAFKGAYPGAALLHEIKGCDVVVNGHMHKTAPSIEKGQTIWHNPGNIIRLSLDTKDHVPSVWEWTPDKPRELLQHPLQYVREVFDLTGTQVAPASNTALKKSLPKVMKLSQFAELLSVNTAKEARRSGDGGTMEKEIRDALSASEAPEALRALLSALAKEVSEDMVNQGQV
jgi:hypothetical protein